ncbi:MAG: PQQ-binding-like beta-propeller repeat protein [Bryobacteraceae bacterium]|nr:PQQ-binding-like beta-propeller repeat protein [Bryobacteraceae bacterium]MDW8378453.1 PQQ-binding-like beta-propeller repeat protein [Bryobacterales bacterium]
MRLLLALLSLALAEDWPEWRGRGRRGVWREPQLETLSHTRLAWRAPLGGGFAGPAVAQSMVFVTDYGGGRERALAFDERTGKLLWQVDWPADYQGMGYASGPRATPTVDGDRVYVLGASGELQCLRIKDGSLVWRKNFRSDYQAALPTWGFASAPLVYRNLLIAVVGGPQAKVIAFEKTTGREQWQALSSDTEPGYSQPFLVDDRRLVIWHAGAVTLLDPRTGKLIWEHPFRIHMNTPIATPVADKTHLLVTAFFQGARLLHLDTGALLWRGQSESEVRTDTIHAAMATPVLDGDFIYGICAYGELRCLKRATGERVWETQQVTVERARNATAFIVRNGDRYLFYNDRGELILGELRPQGYREISRVKLLEPTSAGGGRRQLGAVNWVHPAFANGHVVVRNDRELMRFSLLP